MAFVSMRLTKNVSPNLSFLFMSWLNGATKQHCSEGKLMVICERLRALREEKKMSQGDIERRTGLLRCYISRVENGHTVPSVETLEKMARALEVPMYRLFYDGEAPPKLEKLPQDKIAGEVAWGSSGEEARYLSNLRRFLGRVEEADRKFLLMLAHKLASKGRKRKSIAD